MTILAFYYADVSKEQLTADVHFHFYYLFTLACYLQ